MRQTSNQGSSPFWMEESCRKGETALPWDFLAIARVYQTATWKPAHGELSQWQQLLQATLSLAFQQIILEMYLVVSGLCKRVHTQGGLEMVLDGPWTSPSLSLPSTWEAGSLPEPAFSQLSWKPHEVQFGLFCCPSIVFVYTNQKRKRKKKKQNCWDYRPFVGIPGLLRKIGALLLMIGEQALLTTEASLQFFILGNFSCGPGSALKSSQH